MRWEIPASSDIDSIKIVTTCRGYCPSPAEIGDEVEQTFKIFVSGHVRFIRSIYGQADEEYSCLISKESAADIIKAVSEGLKGPICEGCDMRVWFVNISSIAECDHCYHGSIDGSDLKYGRYNLSEYIRRTLIKGRKEKNGKPMPFDPKDCLLFDGHCDHLRTAFPQNCDKITRTL